MHDFSNEYFFTEFINMCHSYNKKKLTCVLGDKSRMPRSKIFKDFFPHLPLEQRKILCLWAHPVCVGVGE